MNDNNNYQILFDLFKEIEAYLSKVVNEDIRNFNDLLKTSCEKQPHIKKYSGELNDLSLIRTLIAHKKREHLILIPESTIKRVKEILDYIRNPPTVLEKFEKKVYVCDSDNLLIDILKVMKKETFTHIPVYNKGKIKGILSEVSVTNWLADKKEINLKNIIVGDLGEFLDNQPNEFFDFVKKDEDAYKVKERFLNEVKDKKRLGAIFITENGKKEEKLLGVITAWDIPILD